MVKLRSKLHLSRQTRKSSLSYVASPDQCNATVPIRTAGSLALDRLPDDLLARIASFCDLADILRLRCSSRPLRFVLDKSSTLEKYLRRLVSILHLLTFWLTYHCGRTISPPPFFFLFFLLFLPPPPSSLVCITSGGPFTRRRLPGCSAFKIKFPCGGSQGEVWYPRRC